MKEKDYSGHDRDCHDCHGENKERFSDAAPYQFGVAELVDRVEIPLTDFGMEHVRVTVGRDEVDDRARGNRDHEDGEKHQ